MKILQFLFKIVSIIPSTLGGVMGVVQAIIKFVKEVCTLALNILVPVIPQLQGVVLAVRAFMNVIDEVFNSIKEKLLVFSGIKLENK